jgi:hypothetical protein
METNNKSAVGKKRKKNGFTQISNELLENERLSWRAKGLLTYMMSRPNNWKINKSDLYKRATEGRDSLKSAIDELKAQGYLHIYRTKNESGQFDGWVWEYDDIPFVPEALENRSTENQHKNGDIMSETRSTENPYYGKPEVRKSSVYNNTDFNNTDFNNTDNKEINKTYDELEFQFELFWKAYPLKRGSKANAKKSFKNAIKNHGATYDLLVNGIEMYKKYIEYYNVQEEFIMHGSTWLNQKCWENDYTCKPKSVKGKRHGFAGLMLNELEMQQKNIIDYEETIINEKRRNENAFSQNSNALPFRL